MRLWMRERDLPSEDRPLKDMASKFLGKRKYKEAISCYKKALELKPKDYQTLVRLANTYVSDGQLKEAIKAYTAAGEAYEKDGCLQKALAAYKVLYSLEPDDQLGQKIATLEKTKHVKPELVAPRDPNPQYWGGIEIDLEIEE